LRVYYGLDISLWQVEQAEVSGTIRKNRPGRYNQNKSMAGRYGARVYIRRTIVPLLTQQQHYIGGDHTSRHIEKKHSNEIRGRTDC
jgi:hypothetical protein